LDDDVCCAFLAALVGGLGVCRINTDQRVVTSLWIVIGLVGTRLLDGDPRVCRVPFVQERNQTIAVR
jgi:hypothetical protein